MRKGDRLIPDRTVRELQRQYQDFVRCGLRVSMLIKVRARELGVSKQTIRRVMRGEGAYREEGVSGPFTK